MACGIGDQSCLWLCMCSSFTRRTARAINTTADADVVHGMLLEVSKKMRSGQRSRSYGYEKVTVARHVRCWISVLLLLPALGCTSIGLHTFRVILKFHLFLRPVPNWVKYAYLLLALTDKRCCITPENCQQFINSVFGPRNTGMKRALAASSAASCSVWV